MRSFNLKMYAGWTILAALVAGPAALMDQAVLSKVINMKNASAPGNANRLTIDGIMPLDIELAGTPTGNTFKIGTGDSISFCPILACVMSPNIDHQRASVLVSAITQDDMHSEEQTLAVMTVINKGALKTWAPDTVFITGDNVAFGATRNSVYRAVQSGRSATDGEGPFGKGSEIHDGSVVWQWINDAAIAAKVGAYVETAVMPGAGAAWGAAFNYHMTSGVIPSFNPGVEFDYVNESGRSCAVGVADCTNLRVAAGGPDQVTTNLAVLSDNTTSYAAIWGLRLNGDHLASEAAIEVDASSRVGLAFGVSGLGGASHSIATIEDITNSPTALSIGGLKSIAGIVEQSTGPNGIALNGRYSGAQIIGNNFILDPGGNVVTASITETRSNAPKSGSSPCTIGQHAWDQNFEYRCVAANRWKRMALTPF